MTPAESEALLFASELRAPPAPPATRAADPVDTPVLDSGNAGALQWWRRRQVVRDPAWLIDPATSSRPAWWPGWPRPGRFAFSITHDVESQGGLDRCRALAEVELRLGFRSAFNFATGGGYSVSAELRRELTQLGFEVAVLGSRHRAPADRPGVVSRCLCDWGAVGFRAGRGMAGPNGVGDLGIEYDSSISDTGTSRSGTRPSGSIFPSWIERAVPSGGFVELPVTLPHDSVLMRIGPEHALTVWQAKAAWIARHGGLALLNLRADSINFRGREGDRRQLPVESYAALLQWIRDQYAARCWLALPRDVARHVRQCHPAVSACARPPAACLPVRRAVMPAT
ncbi:MAG: hypothetical protein JSR48_01710 [Verrucomicrobia bacterium]|nr:hypothetical protein [Verrucomicrobiota bacterium]